MTPKEKAKDLHNDIYRIITHGKAHSNRYLGVEYISDKWEDAKQCALITANEVLGYSKVHGFIGLTEYWEEVKQETKKL
jgi:hypothetical protein